MLLDAEAEKVLSSKDSSTFVPERKRRVISDTLSVLQPPPNAPAWAIQSTENSTGMFQCVLSIVIEIPF